jgi:Lrp/AsnC family leucine-responsive transcriptional regulator
MAEFGRRVSLSAPALAERVQRLERSGVTGYRATVDPRAIGYPVAAVVRVAPARPADRPLPL